MGHDMKSRRIHLTAMTFTLLLVSRLVASPHPADAQIHPPTKADLQQLVAQDTAILPAPYAARLRKKLSDWERGIGVECDKIPNSRPFCFPAAKDVIADIQAHTFAVDGFVIDRDIWSLTIPATDGDSTPVDSPVVLSQIFPKVVSPPSADARAFNEAAMNFGLDIWSRLGGPPRSDPGSDVSDDYSIDYAQNNDPLPGVISVSFSWSDYPHGAAHGEFGGYDFNWDVAQQRPVAIDDIFDTKTDWKIGLATAILAAFQSADDSYFGDSAPADIVADVSDPARWAITKAGLRIDTDAYEVGGYSDGAPSAIASWSSLKPYLKHGGLVVPQ
jgi:hypothetical protein